MELYSKITNQLFYIREGKSSNEKNSILNNVGDDKVILVLHKLYLLTNFEKKALITLDYIIEKCGYSVNQRTRKSFRDILLQLRYYGWINFEGEDGDIKSGQMIEIDTEALFYTTETDFTSLTQNEVKTIMDNEVNSKTRIALIKLYLYLKARTYKRAQGENEFKEGMDEWQCSEIAGLYNYRSQSTYQSYELINRFTNISQSNIKQLIEKLQELDLITYASAGKKYLKGKPSTITECENVYVINNLQPQLAIKRELEIGLKQYCHILREQGYSITDREYINNDRKINGRIGGLTNKLKKGTITAEQLHELNELNEQKKKSA
ncbi:hypothetical protein [Clostridium sp. VAP41]|uniref:hypothetical protein n=1 Tax=Clostridium sp. VAP41 TaxID=2949979 RepID=UPI00207A2C0B|nr:hypothetical protein [Clostridium sp. VAP41]